MNFINSVNLNSAAVAAFVTVILTYGLSRISKGSDARVAAETALFNTSPTIIAEQNNRIANLQSEVDRLWGKLNEIHTQERECQDQLRECRHQVRDLGQKVISLEFKLGQIGK